MSTAWSARGSARAGAEETIEAGAGEDARKTKTVMAYAESHVPASETGNDPVRYARILVRHTFGTQGDAAQEKVAKETTVEALLAAGWPSKLKANKAPATTP